MGKVTTTWLLPGHSGRACNHESVYTKKNKKTGAVYSVKLCNPSQKETANQLTQRAAFGIVSSFLSAWIKENKEAKTEDFKTVKAQYDRQTKYSSLRGMMMGKGMYRIEEGRLVVDLKANTKLEDIKPTIESLGPVIPGGTQEPVNPGTQQGAKKTITASASPSNGGTVTGSGSYAVGEEVTLSASPASGYSFSKWDDGNTSASRQITVSEDKTYRAIFVSTAIGDEDEGH